MTLQGKVFISTVSSSKSGAIRNVFEPLGATIFDLPMTEFTEPEITTGLRNDFNRIVDFQWIIFTSSNGVKYFHKLLSVLNGLISIPHNIKIAVVGPKTALELNNHGRTADYISSGGTGMSLVNELIEKRLLDNCSVLFALGELAPAGTQETLGNIAQVTRVNVYKTVKTGNTDYHPLDMIRKDLYDLILFTSPSGLEYFAETIGPEYLNHRLRLACIGKVTAKAATQLGLSSSVTAETSTYEGLAKEILNYYKIKN
jgi:uroporphyrinogen-III synthase